MTFKPKDAYINTTAEYPRFPACCGTEYGHGGQKRRMTVLAKPVAIYLTGRPTVELVRKFHSALYASHATLEILI
jgi:hypothetical protein